MPSSVSETPTLDSSALYATEHGSVHRTSDRLVTIHLGDLSWTLDAADVASMHDAAHSLAGDVYRCGNDCRWQLRVPGSSVVVLSSTEVLRLDTLLAGAVAMLELDDILTGADVDWAGSGDPVEQQ